MALGDSRDNSVDSRFWGFVPHSHLVGKAVFTFLSFERWLPPIPRLGRFFPPDPVVAAPLAEDPGEADREHVEPTPRGPEAAPAPPHVTGGLRQHTVSRGPLPADPPSLAEVRAARAGHAEAGRQRSPEVQALAGWVRVVGGAVLFALALRVLAFEAYRIPSTSMEDTLLVGDFVLVSKLHYGPRVLGRRLPGVGDVGRGDVAVFNYPPDLDPDPARRTPYIKRIVGLPGDTLAVVAKEVRIGDRALAAPVRGRQSWRVTGALPRAEALDSLGLAARVQRVAEGEWAVSATSAQARALARLPGVDAVEPRLRPLGDGSASFPPAFRYSLDDYGPVVVPRRGRTVALDDLSWAVLRTVIERYEGHTAERTADGFLIDGRPAETYTFDQDYYFALGDSRDDSADSRTWGVRAVRPRRRQGGRGLLFVGRGRGARSMGPVRVKDQGLGVLFGAPYALRSGPALRGKLRVRTAFKASPSWTPRSRGASLPPPPPARG